MPILCWSLRGPITTRAVCAAPISLSVELTAYGKPRPLGRYFDESKLNQCPGPPRWQSKGSGELAFPSSANRVQRDYCRRSASPAAVDEV